MHWSQSSDLAIAVVFSARGYFNFFFSSIILCLHLFNVFVTYADFSWTSIEFYFYASAVMSSLLTSILITARHDGLLTIAAV